jgi:hypothetical protein
VKRIGFAALPRPYRTALVVIAIATMMGGVFAASYSLALARPKPRHIPSGLVGSTAQRPALVEALERATGGALAFRPYRSAAAAEAAMGQQSIYAALVAGPGQPRLLIASAAGASVARVLEEAAGQVPVAGPGASSPLRVVDLYPLPAGDPQGLVSFYVTLAASIIGFITMFQLRANASGLSLRGWLISIGVLVVLGGLVLAVVADPIIGALNGPFPELWAALSAEMAVSALFSSAMLVLAGRWAMIPTWLLFVALGNASSGGAVAPPLLPAFYAFFSRVLPPGVTVEIVRTAVYFRHAQHPAPFIVQGAWLACSLAALLFFARRWHRSPAA